MEIFNVIEMGDLNRIMNLLNDKNIDINITDKNENTILIAVSCKGYIDIIRLLLNRENLNIDPNNEIGYKNLIYALFIGDKRMIDLLIKHKNLPTSFPLHLIKTITISDLFKAGNKDIVQLLLEKDNLDLNLQFQYYRRMYYILDKYKRRYQTDLINDYEKLSSFNLYL
jgi:ankyrin repeat protein